MDHLIQHLVVHVGHHFAIEAGHALRERSERESQLLWENGRIARQECKRLLLENGEILDVIDYRVKYERKGGYGLIASWAPCEDNSLVVVGKIGDKIIASRVRGSLERGVREVVREGAAYSGSESWPAYVEPSALGSGFDEDSFLNVILGLSPPAGPLIRDRKIDLTDLVLKASWKLWRFDLVFGAANSVMALMTRMKGENSYSFSGTHGNLHEHEAPWRSPSNNGKYKNINVQVWSLRGKQSVNISMS